MTKIGLTTGVKQITVKEDYHHVVEICEKYNSVKLTTEEGRPILIYVKDIAYIINFNYKIK